ncbi:endonuclease/exonuclease/phosphatase family protein [Microbacterium sp. NPDC057407]|uniref:endonuclease/exonuclease/phosphatase family protein n=1 Tax=Microbacterium sp. NPDC057407 TaxID=3346120 RepID=UPI0036720281
MAAVPVAQALVPVGAMGLVALALIAGVFRIWAAAIVLLIGAVISGVPTLTPVRAVEACKMSGQLTVMAFNAKFAGADPAELSALIRTTGADAVVLLETDEELIDVILTDHELADILPYRTREVDPRPASGSVILSAYPLSLEEDILGSEFDQVSAVATIPGAGGVRLAAVHPPPPTWQPNGWLNGLDDIATWVQETPDGRLIVAGDFNASFAHPVLRRLASDLRTGAEAAGPIPWPTWPEEKPVPAFTTIDHIFARGATPTDWDSAYIEGSDHRAVVAQWSLCADNRDD